MAPPGALIAAVLAAGAVRAQGEAPAAEVPAAEARAQAPDEAPRAEPPRAAAPEEAPRAQAGNAAAAGVRSSCTVPVPGAPARATLVLVGMRWDDWEEACERLAAYIDVGAPPYDAGRVGASERLLRETGFFKAAACAGDDAGASITCRLVPADIVRDVVVSGDLPFFMLEDDVRQRIFLRPGVLLGEEAPDLRVQARRLRDFLHEEGYFGSHVRVQTRPVSGAEPNRGVQVNAVLDPGEVLHLRQVWLEGEVVLDRRTIEDELRHPVFLFLGRARFQPSQFVEDVERIAALHHRRGWPEARVEGEFFVDRSAGAVDARVTIDAGPRLVLRFEGNSALDDGDLAAVATFREAAIIDAVEVERTAAAIVEAYQRKGYYAARVAFDLGGDDETRLVTYTVDEGPRAEVEEVRFAGNSRVSEKRLREGVELLTTESGLFVNGRWVDSFVAADVNAITAFYRDAGHADVHVQAERQVRRDGSLRAVFVISEGSLRRVAALRFAGLPAAVGRASLQRRLALRPGGPFVPARLDDDRRLAIAILGGAGFTQAQVSQAVVPTSAAAASDVEIHYTVVPGPRTFFGGLLVRGNFRTRRSVVEDALGLVPGEPLDIVAVGRARRRLRNLGIFTSVDLRPLGQWRGIAETWLLASVQERRARSADAVLSFGTDELLSVGADYLDANFLGRAIHLDIRTRLSNATELVGSDCGGPPTPTDDTGLNLRCGRIGNRDLVQVMARAPRPLGILADLEVTGVYDFQDKPVYQERRLGLSAAAIRTVEEAQLTTGMGYELVSTDFFTRRPFERPEIRSDGTIARIVPRSSLDRRDSFTDPRRGYRVDARLELAHPTFAGPLPDAASFIRVIVSASAYQHVLQLGRVRLEGGDVLGGPLVLAVAATAGVAEPWAGARDFPQSEAFSYGGDQSVRGILERASVNRFPGARYLLTGTGELRWYFWQGLGFGTLQVAAFSDVGTVAYEASGLPDNVTLSLGGALRYVTPVGPVSLAYARPATKPEGIAGNGRVHFSFGYTF